MGREGTGREQLAEVQRARILAAMVDVASEHGYGYATVARVVARSGVSRRTFYEQFVDRDECFLAAFDQAMEGIVSIAVPAYRAPSKWRGRVRAGLTVLLESLDREPRIARLVIVETLGAGHTVLEHRRRGIAQIITLIDEEGREAGKGEGPPPLTAEGLVGGALSLIHARIAYPSHASGEEGLIALLNPLVSMIVLPYLGAAAARRELEQPLPQAREPGDRSASGPRSGTGDPLRDLDMRLTYRTLRVLLAIGELAEQGAPPSNREVADAAGIRDQGQVSKLLARLQQLGLVENVAGPRVKGEANGWGLTARGVEVRGVVGG